MFLAILEKKDVLVEPMSLTPGIPAIKEFITVSVPIDFGTAEAFKKFCEEEKYWGVWSLQGTWIWEEHIDKKCYEFTLIPVKTISITEIENINDVPKATLVIKRER